MIAYTSLRLSFHLCVRPSSRRVLSEPIIQCDFGGFARMQHPGFHTEPPFPDARRRLYESFGERRPRPRLHGADLLSQDCNTAYNRRPLTRMYAIFLSLSGLRDAEAVRIESLPFATRTLPQVDILVGNFSTIFFAC